MDWTVNYVFPPWPMISKVLRKLQCHNCMLAVVRSVASGPGGQPQKTASSSRPLGMASEQLASPCGPFFGSVCMLTIFSQVEHGFSREVSKRIIQAGRQTLPFQVGEVQYLV